MTLRVSGKNLDIGEAFQIPSRHESIRPSRNIMPGSRRSRHDRAGGLAISRRLYLASQIRCHPASRRQSPRALCQLQSCRRPYREAAEASSKAAVGSSRGTPADDKSRSTARRAGNAQQQAAINPGKAEDLHPAVIAEPSSGFREMTVSGAAMELDLTNAAGCCLSSRFRRANQCRIPPP